MIKRTLESSLRERMGYYPVVTVTGLVNPGRTRIRLFFPQNNDKIFLY